MALTNKVEVSLNQESLRALKGIQKALEQQNRLTAEQNALLRDDASTEILRPVEVPRGD